MLSEKTINEMVAANITYILDYTKVKRKKLVKVTGLSHGTISTMANHGKPQRLPIIEKLLGHSNIDSTLVYTKFSLTRLKQDFKLSTNRKE